MSKLMAQFRALYSPVQFERFLSGAGALDQPGTLRAIKDYDWHGRKIFFEPYFRALVLHRCSNDKSLHDLQKGVKDDPLYALAGAHMDVSLSALSQANATRPVEPFLQVLSAVLQAIDDLPHTAKISRDLDSPTLKKIANLLEEVKIFDATCIKLPDKIATWARHKNMKASVKLQLRISAGYGGLDRLLFTPAAGNDNPAFIPLLDLKQDGGAIYLFDTGYFKIATYDQIIETGNHFVTLRNRKINVTVLEERTIPAEPLENGYVIHKDQIVHLGTGKRKSSHLYRLVEVTDTRGNQDQILTDLLDLEVDKLCALRTYRWCIETVFRWLKAQLKLNQLMAYSPRGVMVQTVMALIVYGLLVLYNQGKPLSMARLTRQIRLDLHQALFEWAYQMGYHNAHEGQSGPDPPKSLRIPTPAKL